MATILEDVKKIAKERPIYTQYELAKMVRSKRKNLNYSIKQFADFYNTLPLIIQDIEEANRIFDVEMYKTCAIILEMTMDELLDTEKDELEKCVSLRSDTISDKVFETVSLANLIFDEMVMQKKISVR